MLPAIPVPRPTSVFCTGYIEYDDTSSFILNKMKEEGGFFIGRIPGSDYDAAVARYTNDNYMNHMGSVKSYNGYFDKETDDIKKKENYEKYLDIMIKCYIDMDVVSQCFSCVQNGRGGALTEIVTRNKPIIEWGHYIEPIYPFLTDFKIFAENKKVLIVSPFSESIKFQYTRKDILVPNYVYPEFELLTYDTPITYNSSEDTLDHIETNNWLEQCEKMESEISKLDFDIALLSCGSYAMYLGNAISKKMNKKAIYIGGIVSAYFNLKSTRYAIFFPDNNKETEIEAFEKASKCDVLLGGRDTHSEALRAYF